ncbi:hypothetical protein EKO04_003966 [Ascochyta lentis]|uniref:Altered inheritance of mitochondria protein 6 n=1 Tax=Ascochyta lentis TaxID=205686 RepID=A0A8H7J921_9PLEO|nr:hypothetical protein EKO04_003966 [Ascochyta lentis]
MEGVRPISCHSHNDYWRKKPLYEALQCGCTSVEADVWLVNDDLLVGHSRSSLQKEKTLWSLYVDPLVRLLDDQNHNQSTGEPIASTVKNGVFSEDPTQTLVLLVDVKDVDAQSVLPVISAHLSALRRKDYLSYWNGSELRSGPITVVLTGNAPFNMVNAPSAHRDIFFDAPLADLSEEPKSRYTNNVRSNLVASRNVSKHVTSIDSGTMSDSGSGAFVEFNVANSYFASVSFRKAIGYTWFGRLSSSQIKTIRGQIKEAQRRGLKVRYWATPTWPIAIRNHIWQILLDEGVDYLNVDDVWAAKKLLGMTESLPLAVV